MRYLDTVKIATTTADGYGDETVVDLEIVPANFIKRHGVTHTDNINGETSDAAVYLEHTNEFVLSKLDDLEGMYIQAEPFTDGTWYKISSCNVAERKLLNNAIDNVYCRLEKVAGLAYVYIS